MARKRGSRKTTRRKSVALGLIGIALGVGSYIIFDAIVKPHIPVTGIILAVGEIALGFYLSKKSGVLKGLGLAMIFLNMFALFKTYASPMLSGIGGIAQLG